VAEVMGTGELKRTLNFFDHSQQVLTLTLSSFRKSENIKLSPVVL
jgi:hypothetical protein